MTDARDAGGLRGALGVADLNHHMLPPRFRSPAPIRRTTCARSGLVGNPSDLFGGKVISLLFDAFSARVSLYESEHLTVLPNARGRHQLRRRGGARPLPAPIRLLRRDSPDRGPPGALPPPLPRTRHRAAAAQLYHRVSLRHPLRGGAGRILGDHHGGVQRPDAVLRADRGGHPPGRAAQHHLWRRRPWSWGSAPDRRTAW